MTVEPKLLESRGDAAVDPVRLIGPDPSESAQMLAAVITANLQRQPDLHQRLDGEPGVVSVTALDAGSTVTFELRDGCVRVYSGEPTCPADVRVVADSGTLSGLATVPRIGPLPNPLKSRGREFWRSYAGGRLKAAGVFRHRLLLRRLVALLSTGPA